MLIADRAGRGVDHADRVVVVVGNDQGLAVGGDIEAAGVGLHSKTDALVGVGTAVAQGDHPGRGEGAAALDIDIDRVIVAAGGVERIAVRSPDQSDMGVRLLDDLGQLGIRLIGARHVV